MFYDVSVVTKNPELWVENAFGIVRNLYSGLEHTQVDTGKALK